MSSSSLVFGGGSVTIWGGIVHINDLIFVDDNVRSHWARLINLTLKNNKKQTAAQLKTYWDFFKDKFTLEVSKFGGAITLRNERRVMDQNSFFYTLLIQQWTIIYINSDSC